ncbi:hypothetical protein NDU88_003481 [Pleurodeles waltl]|uniref:Uncharacterized protein n=1 Tax=Pleurodeles waltl TaxID=8319 RepID=A0AAV7QFI5_PLEWA|nr:hypothetical protein NDU88_003481 [Pleurodeles waltl]
MGEPISCNDVDDGDFPGDTMDEVGPSRPQRPSPKPAPSDDPNGMSDTLNPNHLTQPRLVESTPTPKVAKYATDRICKPLDKEV